jgi:molybdopterin synthase catalytic subunit
MPVTPMDIIKLVREPIEPQALVAYVRGAADGAIVMFDGFVRDHSKNRRTQYLEYEAYAVMALTKMRTYTKISPFMESRWCTAWAAWISGIPAY